MSVSAGGRNDLRIQEAVQTELNWDPRFAPAEVGVEVDDGVVTLQGTVATSTTRCSRACRAQKESTST